MKLSNTKLVLLAAVGYAVLAVGLLVWLVLSVNNLGVRLESEMSVIANQRAAEKTFSDLERTIAETESQRSELASHVLTESDTISFLSQVEAVGRGLGLEFSTESLKVEEQESAPEKVLRVAFLADGDTARVRELLAALETLPYHSRLDSINLNTSIDGVGSVSVVVLVSLQTDV